MGKPKVGQILYSLNVGNAARGRVQKLTEVTVTKVGRKYFYASSYEDGKYPTKYHVKGWEEATDYSANSLLYENKEGWMLEKEARRICNRISDAFNHGRNQKKLSILTLRKIDELLS